MPSRALRAEPEEGGGGGGKGQEAAPSPLGLAEKKERGVSYRSVWVKKIGRGEFRTGRAYPLSGLIGWGTVLGQNFRTSELQNF